MNIEVSGLVKRYGRVRALDRVSLEIASGQIVALLGLNGAGKTTLLRCLAGLAGSDEGEIYFDDQPLRRERIDLRQRFCFLPDFPGLFLDRSVLRNIGIWLRLYEAERPGIEEQVASLLGEFDLLPQAHRVVGGLSRGQIYKTALAALIAVDPEVWLLDEPFASGMDPHGINMFKRHAQAAARRGRTIIYSTQLLDLAERFSDRVCVIHQGEIRAFDTLERLRESATDKNNVLEGLFQQLRDGA